MPSQPTLSTALGRALAVAPSSVVDIASLCLGGRGLGSAVAQTVARTRPTETPGLTQWLGYTGFVVGLGLAVLVAFVALDKADALPVHLGSRRP